MSKATTKIYSKVEDNIDNYNKTQLQYNPVYAKTQPALIELIDHYWSDKFKDNNYDRSGWKKMFFNVIQNPTLVASKQVDLDTKNIQVIAENGQSYYPAWFFGKELNTWMKEKDFGMTLNNFVFNNPKYGSTVFKKAKKGVKIVPTQNIKFDPKESDFNNTRYIIEEHGDTAEVLKDRGKNWDSGKIQAAITKAEGNKIKYYEQYGAIEGETDNYFIVDENENVFYSDKLDVNDLYRKHDWETIPGRAQGRGQPERLFEAQIQKNKVTHYKTKGLNWTSKHLWQTRDETFTKNLTTDVSDGDVLKIQSELQPVAMEERNLHAYREEDAGIDMLVDRLTFAFDVVRGERTPAGTPLGSAILQSQMAGGFFDIKREEMGLFLKRLIMDWVIPAFKQSTIKDHNMMLSEFTGEELEKLRKAFAVHHSNRALVDYMAKNGIRGLTPDKVEFIKKLELAKIKKSRETKIPKTFYQNLKYKIDVLITSEQIDTGAKLATLQSVLAMIGSNPTFLQDPRAKSVFYQILNLVGISPTDFDEPEQDLSGFAQVGGSLPRASAQLTGTPMARTATL